MKIGGIDFASPKSGINQKNKNKVIDITKCEKIKNQKFFASNLNSIASISFRGNSNEDKKVFKYLNDAFSIRGDFYYKDTVLHSIAREFPYAFLKVCALNKNGELDNLFNMKNKDDKTPYDLFFENGGVEFDVDIEDKSSKEVLKEILKTRQSFMNESHTVSHYLAGWYPETLEKLADYFPDILKEISSLKDIDGSTPFHFLCIQSYMVDNLFKNHSDLFDESIAIQNDNGKTGVNYLVSGRLHANALLNLYDKNPKKVEEILLTPHTASFGAIGAEIIMELHKRCPETVDRIM